MVTHFLIPAWEDPGRKIVNHRPVQATTTRLCFKKPEILQGEVCWGMGEYGQNYLKNQSKPKVLYRAEFTLLSSMENPGFNRKKAETSHGLNVKTEN